MDVDTLHVLKSVPGAIIGLTVHECAHAWMAWRLGDSTAKEQGRLTLNPIRHIDPLGLLLIVVAGFGWAKPVRFDPANLKQRNRDEILIALAGPLSNLLLGFLILGLARVLLVGDAFSQSAAGFETLNVLVLWAFINFGLGVFNLIPIPPLDGSHVYTTFLKETRPELTATIYRYGTLALLLIIVLERRMGVDILPIGRAIQFLVSVSMAVLAFN
jgi:Zn-dependent protease